MAASSSFIGLGVRVDVLISSPQIVLNGHPVIIESLEVEISIDGAQQELVGLVLWLTREVRQVVLDLRVLRNRHLTMQHGSSSIVPDLDVRIVTKSREHVQFGWQNRLAKAPIQGLG